MNGSETALCRTVVAWLQAEGWDVYQEVETRGSRADIVACKGRLRWVIEAKRSLSLAVIEQAEHWIGAAHMVSVAVPSAGRGGFGERVCRDYGIGVLTVWTTVRISQPAPFHRPRLHWFDTIPEACKTFSEAGNATSSYWSPWRETCMVVRERVAQGRVLVKDLVDGIKHHYASDASARACLVAQALRGDIKGVRVVRDGRRLYFEQEVGVLGWAMTDREKPEGT